MKKILFIIPSFTVGGTLSSLAALLPVIKDRYDISIYSRSALGGNRLLLGDYNILKENVWLSNTVRSRGRIIYLLSLFIQFFSWCCSRIGVNVLPYYAKRGCKCINANSYDLIVSYQESLANFVQFFPGRKACWIHSDIRRSNYGESFSAFDYIICVSEFARNCFLTAFPYMTERAIVVYNFVNETEVLRKSNENTELDSSFVTSKFTIISVGRFDPIKQFEKIPDIAYAIKQKIGSSFKWYIVGANHSFLMSQERIREKIVELGLSSEVVILAEKTNVYPYIKNSDVLVVTSESETFSLVAFEAWTLGTPVIINDIPIAYEILKGKTGYISRIEEMPESILKIYNNPFRVRSFERLSSSTLLNFESIVG